MKALTLNLLLCCSCLMPAAAASDAPDWKQESLHDIPYRMLKMDFPFRVDYNHEVREELHSYLRTGRRETEKMLGRSVMYFPIFEHYLQQRNLPKMLKYIPLLESRLKPGIESAAGAAGLWQFMPATGKGFGLRIDEWSDERKDPYRSTEAAVRYLSRLYRQFGEWSLVLAAYNCGPGRVQRALDKTGCDNFWDIAHHLPRQTRAYLPRIIATMYVAEQYQKHHLKPRFRAYQRKSFSVFRVHRELDLEEIAYHCDMSVNTLLAWNPGYLATYIPERDKPHYLILPDHALSRFQKYIIKESRRPGEDYAIAVLKAREKQLESHKS